MVDVHTIYVDEAPKGCLGSVNDMMSPVSDSLSLAWRSARILYLAWSLRRRYKQAEKLGDAARAAGDVAQENAIWDDFNVRASRIVCSHMVALQGVWIKLGQFLSTRADVLPDSWVESLKTLQDAVPRESWRETSQTLKESFGSVGLAAFASIDREPLACASIASVHRATLASANGAVVIKVQRRGIREIIESDLRNLRFIVRRAAKEDHAFDYVSIIVTPQGLEPWPLLSYAKR